MARFGALKLLVCYTILVFIEASSAHQSSCTSLDGFTVTSCKEFRSFCCGKHRTQCCNLDLSINSRLLIGGAMLLIVLPVIMSGWCFPFFPCCCWFGGSGHSSLDSSSSSSSSSSDSIDDFSGGSGSD